MIKRVVVVLAMAAIVCMPAVASASWSFSMGEDGNWNSQHYNFNLINHVIVTPGYTFEGSGVTNITSPGWSAGPLYSGATRVDTSGPAETGVQFWTWSFSGSAPATMLVDYYVWANGVNVGAAEITITNGTSWSWRPISTVPIPAAAWLLGSGLIGLVAIRRRLRK